MVKRERRGGQKSGIVNEADWKEKKSFTPLDTEGKKRENGKNEEEIGQRGRKMGRRKNNQSAPISIILLLGWMDGGGEGISQNGHPFFAGAFFC
jgi:hypothetical protein